MATPELLQAERLRWGNALERYSIKQIEDAAFVVRRYFQWRPPHADEFARLMDKRAGRPMDRVSGKRFDAPVASEASKRFFNETKSILGG